VKLSADTVAGFLADHGVVPRGETCAVEALGGGISNDVWRIRWSNGDIVVKQALPFLRVAEVWAYTVDRSRTEHRCLSTINRLLGPGHAPEVLFFDDETHVFAMTTAPPGGTQWKELLLADRIDPRDAYRAGDLLGRIHLASSTDATTGDDFDDLTTMIEGRIDPYHRTVASRHEDLAPIIDAEITRLLADRRSLVLGDYAPKNLIAYPDTMLVLDVEVAHWGDPVFDVAFCLNHLCLKALHLTRHRALLAGLARAFVSAYRDRAPHLVDEPGTIAELGILMVARVDGKSPAEYLDQRSIPAARAIGRSLLIDPPGTIYDAIERVEVGAP
jgi:aminoglycoside phosphotransferase (APT) family kinase protein